jgi:hypothetical protein
MATNDGSNNAVETRVAELMAEYSAHMLGEDADEEAFIERMWTLLENLRQSPEANEVAIESITTFLDRVERTSEPPS